MQRHDDALVAYRSAFETRNDYAPAQLSYALALARKGDHETLGKMVEVVKTVSPKRPQTFYLEAVSLAEQRRLRPARDLLDQALQLAPEEPRANFFAAQLDYQMSLFDRADARLTSLLKRYPGYDDARRLLVDTLMRTGNPARAVQVAQPLLPRIERDVTGLTLVGEAYLQNQQPQNAAVLFERALAVDAGDVRARTGLALAHAAGNPQRGVRELEAIASSDEST